MSNQDFPSGGPLGRREFLQRAALTTSGAAAAAVVLVNGACAPAASPAVDRQPGATSGKASWELEWDTLVEAAKREGKLIIATLPGSGYRKTLDAFEAAFPGITADHAGMFSRDLAPRVIQERKAGVFAWDIAQIPSTTALSAMFPEGVFDPIRPAISRPDTTEDRAWHGGYEDGFVDDAKKWTFSFGWALGGGVYLNTDLAKESDIKSFRDLLDPKWKGKTISLDPRTGGAAAWPLTVARLKLGDGILKQLYVDQEAALTREPRQAAESMVRGRHAFALGASAAVMADLQSQGLGKNAKLILLPDMSYISGETIWLMNRAPHPNAAKLYINWLLSKAGQEVWSRQLEANSRRTDVDPFDRAAFPSPDKAKDYIQIHRQRILADIELTQELAKKLLN